MDMEKPLLEQFGRQRCGVFLSADPKDLESLKHWLRLVDFHCAGGVEWTAALLPGAGPYECAVPAGIGTPGACHEPSVRAEGIPFCR